MNPLRIESCAAEHSLGGRSSCWGEKEERETEKHLCGAEWEELSSSGDAVTHSHPLSACESTFNQLTCCQLSSFSFLHKVMYVYKCLFSNIVNKYILSAVLLKSKHRIFLRWRWCGGQKALVWPWWTETWPPCSWRLPLDRFSPFTSCRSSPSPLRAKGWASLFGCV